MLCFITENTGDWSGIFYAVESDEFVDIEDECDPSFYWRGLISGNDKVLISYMHPHATHIVCKDKEVVVVLSRAVNLFESGSLGIVRLYENIVSAGLSDKPWAKYRIHVSYNQE